MSTPANEDRLKKLLRTNMSNAAQNNNQHTQAPQQQHVEVNVNGYISPVANIKVV